MNRQQTPTSCSFSTVTEASNRKRSTRLMAKRNVSDCKEKREATSRSQSISSRRMSSLTKRCLLMKPDGAWKESFGVRGGYLDGYEVLEEFETVLVYLLCVYPFVVFLFSDPKSARIDETRLERFLLINFDPLLVFDLPDL